MNVIHFNVILIDVSKKRGVVVRHNNVDLISETYEDITSGELQLRRFQPLHSALTTVLREKGYNIYK